MTIGGTLSEYRSYRGVIGEPLSDYRTRAQAAETRLPRPRAAVASSRACCYTIIPRIACGKLMGAHEGSDYAIWQVLDSLSTEHSLWKWCPARPVCVRTTAGCLAEATNARNTSYFLHFLRWHSQIHRFP